MAMKLLHNAVHRSCDKGTAKKACKTRQLFRCPVAIKAHALHSRKRHLRRRGRRAIDRLALAP